MTVNTAAIQAAWDDAGPNTIVLDQGVLTGPTHASGDIEDVLCFTSGTMIETSHGPVRVEHSPPVGAPSRTRAQGDCPSVSKA